MMGLFLFFVLFVFVFLFFCFLLNMDLSFKYNELNGGILWVVVGGGCRRLSHHRLKLLVPPGKLFFLSFLFHF
jgi:uncharacterized SAM-binding protein YcdF (DUF218 family)